MMWTCSCCGGEWEPEHWECPVCDRGDCPNCKDEEEKETHKCEMCLERFADGNGVEHEGVDGMLHFFCSVTHFGQWLRKNPNEDTSVSF